MKDIIFVLGLILGIALIILSKKVYINKHIKTIGIFLVVVCLVIYLPDFLRGFLDGLRGI